VAPIVIAIDAVILIMTVYFAISLSGKLTPKHPHMLFYILVYFTALLMMFCSILYNINWEYFFCIQRYGVMFLGGLLTTFLAMAAFYDNFDLLSASLLSLIPVSLLFYYLYITYFNIYSFGFFLIIQLVNLVIVGFTYSGQAATKKVRFLYSAFGVAVAATLVEMKNLSIGFITQDEIFHFMIALALLLLYVGLISDKKLLHDKDL
jgi:hypothetical protein